MQRAITTGKVVVHLAFGEPVVVQIVQTGGGELGVERAELGGIEGIIRAVVDAGEKAHQAAWERIKSGHGVTPK